MKFVSACDQEDLIQMLYGWTFWARRNQLPPTTDDWTTWLILGGRGAGKTRAGAEWIRTQIENGKTSVAIVGETYEDAREVMIEGPSGLRNIGPPDQRPEYTPSRHRLEWPNGATGHVFSADDPDGLRGFQFAAAWSDEIAKWRHPEEAWSNLQLCLRLGDRPRQVATTTPRPSKFLKSLIAQPSTATTRTATHDNRAHLAQTFLDEIAGTYAGTRLGRQELLGEILEDVDGALWSISMIDAVRIAAPPPSLDRIVVAVDPPITGGEHSDECGIIVAGIKGVGADAHGYILADLSVHGQTPASWARTACDAASTYQADRIVAEVNQGGDLVEHVLRTANANVPIRKVHATRGKIIRAEPVAALYEQGRIHHVGTFPDLEDQLTGFTGTTTKSPDRLDATVWAITDLMLGPSHCGPSVRPL